MPKISVIVPVYNVEPYLDRCIESILAQTFIDFELILVDDGSPDNCPKMCDEWATKDNRIKVIHKTNGGLASARNAGIDICEGEYVLFCDSDDYVSNEWCSSFLQIANENNFIYIFGGMQIVNMKDDVVLNNKVLAPSPYNTRYSRSHFCMLHTKGYIGFACNVLYRTSILKEHNIRFKTDVIIEDLPFNLEYLQYMNHLEYTSHNGYYYIHRERTTLSTKYYVDGFKKYQEKYSALQRFINTCIEPAQQKECKEIIATNYLYYFLSSLNNTFDKRNKSNIVQKIVFNNNVKNSPEFQHCLKYAKSINENPIYVQCLKRYHYFIAYIYVKAALFKRWLKRKENTK